MRAVEFGRFALPCRRGDDGSGGMRRRRQRAGLPNNLYLQQHSGSSPIKHVVMIVQENRSFNNLFAGFPGTNGTMRGKEKIKKGGKWVDKWVTLKEQSLVPSPKRTTSAIATTRSLKRTTAERWTASTTNPKTFARVAGAGDPCSLYPYQYVNPADIAPYWDMAEQYVLADAMFQTQGSGSFTAHQDLIRGGSALDGPYGSGAEHDRYADARTLGLRRNY